MVNKNIFKRKYILMFLTILLLITAALVFSLFQPEPKPDPASARIICEIAAKQLNKDPNELTDEDFTKIKVLELNGGLFESSELKDIKIMEKFTNLEIFGIYHIYFHEKEIPKWMGVLAKFGIYDLNEQRSIDLSPLEKLNKLKKLDLIQTNIFSLKSIRKLKYLQELSLSVTQVSDLQPIRQMKDLKQLTVENSPVSDLEPLQKLTKLKYLNINYTKVSDIKPLAHMNSLGILILDKTNVSDLEPLKKLKNLNILSITNCSKIKSWQKEDLQTALPELEILK